MRGDFLKFEHTEYTPYGEMWVEDQTTEDLDKIPYRFTSKEWDEETELYYMSARYQDPMTSRWISADPKGYELINPMERDQEGRLQPKGNFSIIESNNWYSYTSNNPIRLVDPTGLDDEDVIGKSFDEIVDMSGTQGDVIKAAAREAGFDDDFSSFSGFLTIGGSVGGSCGVTIGGEGGRALVFEDGKVVDKFDYGSFSLGADTNLSGSAVASFTIVWGGKRGDVSGQSVTMGGSFTPFPGGSAFIGLETVTSMINRDSNAPFHGINVRFGLGAGLIPGSGSATVNFTSEMGKSVTPQVVRSGRY